MAGVTTAFAVHSQRPGFWRVGRQWTGTETVAEDALTAAQWQALKADPNFSITPLPADPAAEAAQADKEPEATPATRRKRAPDPD